MPTATQAELLKRFVAEARATLAKVTGSITGSIEDSIQAIVEIREFDCGGEWVVYVETALASTLTTMWLFLVPQPSEIFENYLEPKAGRRGQRRGRSGDRERRRAPPGAPRLFFQPPIPDVDQQIANRVPGRGFFQGRKIGLNEWVFWTGINVADRIFWHWLLVEALDTFTTTWSSGLLESGECVRGGVGYAIAHTGPGSGNDHQDFWSDNATLLVNKAKNMFVSNNGTITWEEPGQAIAGIAVIEVEYILTNAHETEEAIITVGFQFVATLPPHPTFQVAEKATTVTVPPNGFRNVIVTHYCKVPPSVHWDFEYRYVSQKNPGGTTKTARSKVRIQAEGVGNL